MPEPAMKHQMTVMSTVLATAAVPTHGMVAFWGCSTLIWKIEGGSRPRSFSNAGYKNLGPAPGNAADADQIVNSIRKCPQALTECV